MMEGFCPEVRSGWAYLPDPDDGGALEGCMLYGRVSVRDWRHPDASDLRIVQLRGIEPQDGYIAEAVTFAMPAEQLRDIAWDLIEAADRAQRRAGARLRFAVRVATGACYGAAVALLVIL